MPVRRVISPEDVKRVHFALEQAGTIAKAATLLGVDYGLVRTAIAQEPSLQSYLPKATAPMEIEALGRKPLPVDPTNSVTVQAVKAMDEQVKKGFESIGVTGDALVQAMSFRDFGKFHFQDMRHYIGGGIAKLFADLMAEVKVTSKEISESGSDIERGKMLREDRSRCVKHLIDVYDRVREASLTAAVIEAKKKEALEVKSKSKPAFTPLAMSVHGNVTVNEAKNGEKNGASP